MLSKKQFSEKLEELKGEVRELEGVDDQAVILETAARLRGFNYAPPVIMPVDAFLAGTRAELLVEIERIAGMQASELQIDADGQNEWDVKIQHISVLVFYFKELNELRRGVPEAWDEIDELYVHD